MLSDSTFDVRVVEYQLMDEPAELRYKVEVKGHIFKTSIRYQSIERWSVVWHRNHSDKRRIIATIIAWDAMRFLALGGERIYLPANLPIDDYIANKWRHCFLNQFGEWRFRNNFSYSDARLPELSSHALDAAMDFPIHCESGHKPSAPDCERQLLTNGGGKDSLAGMILLNYANIKYDLYEGYLPMGGVHSIQKALLADLRKHACPSETQSIEVTISDDFYSADPTIFEAMGVYTEHYRTDFAVGHTANYVGYIPVILAGGYSKVWFNIEGSADRAMATWKDGESVNHQWCKTLEYQSIMADLIRRVTGAVWFQGFESTLRGLTDTTIYTISATRPDLLERTHSCNLSKPWCYACSKCLFSYLMLSACLGERSAQRIMKLEESLFVKNGTLPIWNDLLDPTHVAWECVAPHAECQSALSECIRQGSGGNLAHLLVGHSQDADSFQRRAGRINWSAVPLELHDATLKILHEAHVDIFHSVVIVGAGQMGLSLSYLLKAEGIDHVVLEAETAGAAWRKRWDSFRINTPNGTLNLPGLTYEGSDPDGFMSGPEVADTLESYAKTAELPVLDRCAVAEATSYGGFFTVRTDKATFVCRVLVAASGEYASPKFPGCELNIPQEVEVLHSSDYTNPSDLRDGSVLVVGGGQSAAQIVEDLLDHNRTVLWSLSDRPSNTRRLRGKDFMEWWRIRGIIHRPVALEPDVLENHPDALSRVRFREFPLVSGIGAVGHSISLETMHKRGTTLLGKLASIRGQTARFSTKADEQIDRAIAGSRKEYELLSAIADDYYATSDEIDDCDESFVPSELITGWSLRHVIPEIDLADRGIHTIIFATGFKSEWRWLKFNNIFDADGYPNGIDGECTIEGLLFMGLFNLQRLSSTCLCNGGRDASTLMPRIRSLLKSPPKAMTVTPLYAASDQNFVVKRPSESVL